MGLEAEVRSCPVADANRLAPLRNYQRRAGLCSLSDLFEAPAAVLDLFSELSAQNQLAQARMRQRAIEEAAPNGNSEHS